MLGIGWKDGVATIVDRRLVHKTTEPDMGEFAGQGVEVFEFIGDVEANDGSAHFRVTLKEPFNAITFKPPEVGQRVKVKLHAKDREAKFDRSDDGTYQHVPGVPDWRRHGDPLKEADEAAVADAKPGGPHLSMAEIVELKKQVDNGEITEAEFEARRSKG